MLPRNWASRRKNPSVPQEPRCPCQAARTRTLLIHCKDEILQPLVYGGSKLPLHLGLGSLRQQYVRCVADDAIASCNPIRNPVAGVCNQQKRTGGDTTRPASLDTDVFRPTGQTRTVKSITVEGTTLGDKPDSYSSIDK